MTISDLIKTAVVCMVSWGKFLPFFLKTKLLSVLPLSMANFSTVSHLLGIIKFLLDEQ